MTDPFQEERAALKDRLRASLFEQTKHTGKSETERLKAQAETLDLMFYRLLECASHPYIETDLIRTALRAQNQYRYTLKALNPQSGPATKT